MIPSWLDKLLKWWAKSTVPEAAYQMTHFLLAYSAQLTIGPKHKWLTAAVVLAFATYKEAWQDPHYEKDPFWAWPGGIEDWTFYQLGTLAAFGRFALLGTALVTQAYSISNPIERIGFIRFSDAQCAYRLHDNAFLPDAICTPGVVRTIDLHGPSGICSTSTKNYRHTTAEMKKQVCEAYGVTPCPHANTLEIDHLLPLEIGGADDVKNLWPQPAQPQPGFHEKDRLENFVHAEICSGTMDVADAQKRMAEDWYQLYLDHGCQKFCQ